MISDTYLMVAVRNADEDLVSLLLRQPGIETEAINSQGETAASLARRQGNFSIQMALLQLHDESPSTRVRKKRRKRGKKNKEKTKEEESTGDKEASGTKETDREDVVVNPVVDGAGADVVHEEEELLTIKLEEELKTVMEKEDEMRVKVRRREEAKVKVATAEARVKADAVINKALAESNKRVRRLEEELERLVEKEEVKNRELKRVEEEKVKAATSAARAEADQNIEKASAKSEENVRVKIAEHEAVLKAFRQNQEQGGERVSDGKPPTPASTAPSPTVTSPSLPECPVGFQFQG